MNAIKLTPEYLKKVPIESIRRTGFVAPKCSLRKVTNYPVELVGGGYSMASFLAGEELVYRSAYQGKRKGVICRFTKADDIQVLPNGSQFNVIEIPLLDLPNLNNGVELLSCLLSDTVPNQEYKGFDAEEYKNDSRVASWS